MIIKIIFIITTFNLLIFNYVKVYSTNVNDSLENVLAKTKTDTAKSRILNILAWNYTAIDSKKSWIYSKKALSIAIKYNLYSEQGSSYNNIGTLYYYVQNLDSALICFQKAKIAFQKAGKINKATSSLQNIAVIYNDKSEYNKAIEIYKSLLKSSLKKKDSLMAANIYNNMGNSFNLMGNYDKAMENFLKAIYFYEKVGVKNSLSLVYYNMGALHYYKGSYDKAMGYCDQSLKIREEIKNPYGIAYSYILKGAIYEAEKKLDDALIVYNKALIIDKELGDKQGIATLLTNISNCYISQNKLVEAQKMSVEALNIAKEIGTVKLQISIYLVLGDIEMHLKNYKVAISNFLQSAIIADSTDNKLELKDSYKGLASVYSLISDYKNAFFYLQKYIDIKDTLFNAEKNKQLTEMDTKYQSEKKEKEILLLNKNKELQKVEIEKKGEQVKRQQYVIVSAIGGLMIVLVFTFFLFRLYSQKKKMNLMLAKQNEDILQKNEEITTQRDEIKAQRDEITKQHKLVTIQKDKIEIIHKEVSDSINYATRLQSAILPDTNILTKYIADCFVLFKPKDKVSGDFYWWAKVENNIVITVADCTGHGVPGAFMSMLGSSLLREIVIKEYITNPAIILKRLRKEIIKVLKQKGISGEQKDGMDMSLITINTETSECQWAGANNPLYIVSSNQSAVGNEMHELPIATASCQLYELKGDKMPIAIYERMDSFSNQEFKISKGDMLFLFSDGFADQFGGPKGKKFMYKQFKEILLSNSQKSMQEQKEILEKAINEWIGNSEQVDDVTVLGIKI